MFRSDWMYSNFADNSIVRITAAIISSVIVSMFEIVTANVCLIHLNVAYLAPLPIVKLEKEKAAGDYQDPFTLDIL